MRLPTGSTTCPRILRNSVRERPIKRPDRSFRKIRIAGLVLVSPLLSLLALPASAQQTAAQQIFTLTNQDRAAQGLPPLAWSDPLANSAQAHAQWMVREPSLSHDYPGEPALMERAKQAGAHFQVIAENIASGWSAEQIDNAWMHSPSHRRNILDPKLNVLGVAVVRRGGQLYAVEDFAETAPPLSLHQVEQRVQSLLRAQGVDASLPPAAAEQACRVWGGFPKGTNARSIVRFQTSDLTRLPPQIVQQIATGKFAKAAIGACPPPSGSDFTTYRVAILFY